MTAVEKARAATEAAKLSLKIARGMNYGTVKERERDYFRATARQLRAETSAMMRT